ncbi:hypothetical protein V3391_03860 [Luteimonas sp. SMYT11W]|uniref:Large polyvalent protein associated domain-containing protein n=1 Tax=Luteimonas flava TaxID=3115822 RepID=A0ABU7WBL1_9GAMM
MHPTVDGYSPNALLRQPASAAPTQPVAAQPVASEGTPQATADAYAAWQEAQQAVDTAPPYHYTAAAGQAAMYREAFEAAVMAEIGAAPPFVGPVPAGTSQLDIAARPLLERYEGNPAAIEIVNRATEELALLQPLSQRPDVQALLSDAASQSNAEAVMRTLSEGLGELSEEDRLYLTTSPELATLIREQVEPWVAEPYDGMEGEDLQGSGAVWASNESSSRLQTLTDGLPPDLAYAVVQGNLDTIVNIAQLRPQYLGNPVAGQGGDSFANIADAVGALGDTPEGNALRTDIATMFTANGVDRGQGVPLATVLGLSVQNGASPGLALEIISQLSTGGAGEVETAELATEHLVQAGEAIAESITGDLENYQSMLEELGALLASHEGLPPEATNAAVENWLEGQDSEWQAQFEQLEGSIIDKATQLRELMAGVSGLPEELASQATGPLQDLFNDESVLNAVNLAASRDRSFLTGPEADAMMALADPARAGAAGAETLRQIGNHAIQQEVSLIFGDLEHGSPASVATARSQLEALGHRVSGLYGSDAEAYRAAINSLDEFASLPANASAAAVEDAATRLNNTLGGIEGFGADTVAGGLLRSLGVAAGVLALNKYASLAIDEGGVHNQIATLGAAAGLGSAAIALLERPGAVDMAGLGALDDARGRLGPLGAANWGRALGVFSAVGDFAYMANALSRDEPLEAGLHGLAGAGTVVLAGASGPAGWLIGGTMIVASMVGQANWASFKEAEQAHGASVSFLVAAGLEPDVAEILANTGQSEGFEAVNAVPLVFDLATTSGVPGTAQRLTPEEAIAALNELSGDPEALADLQLHVTELRLANQHTLLPGYN